MYSLEPISLDKVTSFPTLKSSFVSSMEPKHLSFLDILNRNDALYQNATDKVMKYAAGENIAVHDVMVAMENAKLSFQFAVQVRNKLVESYQEITRMQI
ncbi:flagellar hook-basal body complex protein FliE [Acinetobacter oleivorans]|uniref:flagellar hook-basal body complex protein FliE n=1 Tax=Acinetobacter oleivorans TaxID=1148157 RepID=UPI0019019C5A|nr:flagellar hook-basal body complex protein FliE [Acinetobacter oleivorans]MBJ8499441.1 flagellar hook-basal body complex protein FliE [Acinetobacter oleivorans]